LGPDKTLSYLKKIYSIETCRLSAITSLRPEFSADEENIN